MALVQSGSNGQALFLPTSGSASPYLEISPLFPTFLSPKKSFIMRYFLTIVFCLGLAFSIQAQSLRVQHLTCEHRVNPLGIDEAVPRLSWQLIIRKPK